MTNIQMKPLCNWTGLAANPHSKRRENTHQWWIISQDSSPTTKAIKSRKHATLYIIIFPPLSPQFYAASCGSVSMPSSWNRPGQNGSPGPRSIQKQKNNLFSLTRLVYLTTIVLDSGIWSSKNNPFLPADPTLLRAAWDHPSLCERVPNLDSSGSC